MEDDEPGGPPQRPESLLPYEVWTEEAHRQVVARALAHVAENGLRGEHHFYISFRTDARGVSLPARLRAQYPHEITIVLQHQFWDLQVDDAAGQFSVGLSFGGIPATLTVPLAAITGFADPSVQFGFRFTPPPDVAGQDNDAEIESGNDQGEPERDAPPPESPAPEPQVVSLDAFRKRAPNKES